MRGRHCRCFRRGVTLVRKDVIFHHVDDDQPVIVRGEEGVRRIDARHWKSCGAIRLWFLSVGEHPVPFFQVCLSVLGFFIEESDVVDEPRKRVGPSAHAVFCSVRFSECDCD